MKWQSLMVIDVHVSPRMRSWYKRNVLLGHEVRVITYFLILSGGWVVTLECGQVCWCGLKLSTWGVGWVLIPRQEFQCDWKREGCQPGQESVVGPGCGPAFACSVDHWHVVGEEVDVVG